MDIERKAVWHLPGMDPIFSGCFGRRAGNCDAGALGVIGSVARTARSRQNERGTAVVEFAFCFALFWVPLFLGSIVIGFNLIRAVQVTQVCRDAGHMYAGGIDFSQSTYQNLFVSLAIGLNMSTNGGNGVEIL